MSTKRISTHYDRPLKPRAERTSTRALLQANNRVVRELIEHHCPPKAIVLELGCGKGGAIWKWKAMNFQHYHGVDLSSGAIDEFRRRIRDKVPNVTLTVDDMCRSDAASWQTITGVSIVSTQFCFHYCWETEARWKRCVDVIANSLSTGGKWIGTIVDAAVLKPLLPYQSSICSIQPSIERKDEYIFSLKDAVDKCTEWMVDWDALIAYAKSKELQLVEHKPFSYTGHLYAEQREVHKLYCSFVFEKRITASD